ncbi:colicin transporter [Proteus sp. G2300]|nr:colicin transporter [Proteus sp. G2300]
MNMNKKYYVNNMFWGFFILAIHVILSWEELRLGDGFLWLFMSIINAILYPFAKWAVECFFLKFTTREFWNKGWFIDTPGKKGILALYSIMVFIFAIPISILYIITILVKKPLI